MSLTLNLMPHPGPAPGAQAAATPVPIRSPQDLTAAVLAAMQATPDERLRTIMLALVKHLHGFVQEVGLTEGEFRQATALLARMGELTDDKHNEFVLMAGSLGVSALVCLQNNTSAQQPATTQNLLGPFWRLHSPPTANGGSLLRSPMAGEPLLVELTVQDEQGQPIAGATVDVWHCSPQGLYENQDPQQAEHNLRGQFTTGADGRVWFQSIKPTGYPIPTHTVVGQMLKAQGRHPFRPAHVHALVFKPGYKTLITQLYDSADERIHSDVQFGVTQAVTAHYVRHAGPHPHEASIVGPWFTLAHTLVMSPGQAVLPQPPIK